jgi:hypothetical protein
MLASRGCEASGANGSESDLGRRHGLPTACRCFGTLRLKNAETQIRRMQLAARKSGGCLDPRVIGSGRCPPMAGKTKRTVRVSTAWQEAPEPVGGCVAAIGWGASDRLFETPQEKSSVQQE